MKHGDAVHAASGVGAGGQETAEGGRRHREILGPAWFAHCCVPSA